MEHAELDVASLLGGGGGGSAEGAAVVEEEGVEEQEKAEGRFFLKDKLCALGLADVSIYYGMSG